MGNKIAENFVATNVFQGRTGNTTTWTGVLPANGVRNISFVALVKMADAADLTFTLGTADDAAGTNAAALTINVPIYKDNVRLSADAKAFTEGAATGSFIYVIEVPAIIIPEGKYIGGALSGSGNVANIISVVAFYDGYYKP